MYRPRHRCRLNNVFDTKSQLCAARIKRGREERERERLRGTREKGTCYFRRGSKPRRDYTLSHTVLFRPLSLSLSTQPFSLPSRHPALEDRLRGRRERGWPSGPPSDVLFARLSSLVDLLSSLNSVFNTPIASSLIAHLLQICILNRRRSIFPFFFPTSIYISHNPFILDRVIENTFTSEAVIFPVVTEFRDRNGPRACGACHFQRSLERRRGQAH